eukprot:6766446-Pyramimonas_sp.AAC.1
MPSEDREFLGKLTTADDADDNTDITMTLGNRSLANTTTTTTESRLRTNNQPSSDTQCTVGRSGRNGLCVFVQRERKKASARPGGVVAAVCSSSGL